MNKFFYVLIFLSFFVANAQRNFNQFSIEAGYGFVSPLSEVPDTYGASYSGLKNFDFGVRFMFNEQFGIKASYFNSLFESNRNNGFGSKINAFALKGYYNLANALDFSRSFSDDLGVLLHGGAGYSIMSSNVLTGQDQVYSIIAGFTPQYRLSNRFAFYADFSFFYNLSHDFNYDGTLSTENDVKFKTQMYTISLGLIFNIGSNSQHADWY
jgi:OOP family OmpA-OmpF porin